MEMSESKKNIFKALHDFRTKVKQPSKDKTNPFFKSEYVSLDGVQKSVDEGIVGTGLSYTQQVTTENGKASCATMIMHETGEFIVFDALDVPAQKNDAQGLGSAITYSKRYSLSSAFGISSDDDDDGKEASKKDSGNNQWSKKKPISSGLENEKADPTKVALANKKVVEFSELVSMGVAQTTELATNHLGINNNIDAMSEAEIITFLKYLESSIAAKKEEIKKQNTNNGMPDFRRNAQ